MMQEVKTILVVDDEPEYVEILQKFFEREGFHVLTAHDGDMALKITSNFRPDLVIMDVSMPKKDGLEFYKEISTAHGLAKLPVIVITARGELEPVFRALEVEGFFVKPVMFSKLLMEVHDILKKAKGKTVFLVDNKENLRSLELGELLQKERYRVCWIENPAIFEQEIASGNCPDFVVMEAGRIPAGKEGQNLVQKIRETILSNKGKRGGNVSAKIPLIAYTFSGHDFEKASLEAGVDKYLGRPRDYDAVIVAIREFEIEAKEKKRSA